ncbi:hypothetical protein H6504_04375 [Candidatus Woesearchaeota archaeon]|nr:hypothetical protein [Candidatus Woesearchaeota archaeon]
MVKEYLAEVEIDGKTRFWQLKVGFSVLGGIGQSQLLADGVVTELFGGRTPDDALNHKPARGQQIHDIHYVNINKKVVKILSLYEKKWKFH